MADVTDVETPSGANHTTVVTTEGRSGGGVTWLLVLLLIAVIGVGVYVYAGTSRSEVAKDNAVAQAADSVGDAAGKVGDAAGQVGAAAKDAVNKSGD